ncbi:MAG: hypothetical protein JWM11_3706 [Planctomycetaceae bacterium]|nr:hypothetical protein [Planctomycetaceae bacterium]
MFRRALSWALVFVVAYTAGPLFAQAKTPPKPAAAAGQTKAAPKAAPAAETKTAPKAAEGKTVGKPAPAAATKSPLKAIPGDAAVVLRIKGFQTVVNKVAALADAVQPGSGQSVKFGSNLVGGLISNPTLEGIDQEGEFFLAVFTEKEKQPGLVFVVPSKDLPAMKEALGDAVSFVEVGTHGVYSSDEELINAVKEQIKSKENDSLADAIDGKSAAVMNRGDVSVFVNVPHLLEIYKNEFAAAQGQIENIGKTERPANAPPGMNWDAIMAAVQTFTGKLVKAIEDHDGITISLAFTDKDVVIEKFFKLDDKSETGKSLKGGTGSDMPLLNSLPAGSMGYYSIQCDLSSLTTQLLEFSATVIEDEKVRTSLKDFLKEIGSVKFNGVAGAFNILGNSTDGAFRMVNVVNVSDPQKVRTLSKKYAETLKVFEANNTKTEMTYKSDAEKIGANSIDQTISKITISDDAPDAEKQKKMMKFMYGDGPIVARLAYLKDKLIQTAGGGKEAMESALKSLDSRTSTAAIQAARYKLGAKPNFVGLIDMANLALQGMKIAKDADENALPFNPDAIAKDLVLTPSYIGFALEVEDAALSMKTVVTLDQIKSIAQLVKKTMAAQQGGN